MFILGKILVFLLNPMLWIIVIFLYALFTKTVTRKRKAYWAGIILLLLFSNPLIVEKLTNAYQEKKRTLAIGENFSAGILLGGFSGYNKADQQNYFLESADRFIQTAQLYKTGHISKIVIAAGNANIIKKDDFTEADFVYDQLANLCISKDDLFPDRDSKNTFENALNAKRIIDSLHLAPPYLLITSAIHMPRAMATFKKAGLNVKPYPAAFSVRPKNIQLDSFVPSAKAIADWAVLIKEVTGNAMYRVLGRG